jgi:hypothetical protein
VIAQARYALVDKQIAIVNQRNKIKSGSATNTHLNDSQVVLSFPQGIGSEDLCKQANFNM